MWDFQDPSREKIEAILRAFTPGTVREEPWWVGVEVRMTDVYSAWAFERWLGRMEAELEVTLMERAIDQEMNDVVRLHGLGVRWEGGFNWRTTCS